MQAIPLDTVAARNVTVPKPALHLRFVPLLFLKVSGSQPCLRKLLQPISLHMLINIHELPSTAVQFTGYCNIIQYTTYGINT